jgi:hemoglobin-like flavoprotein
MRLLHRKAVKLALTGRNRFLVGFVFFLPEICYKNCKVEIMLRDEVERYVTPDQRKILQSTFKKLLPVAEVAAELFYRRLFDLAPQVRPMFKVELKEQAAKLMDMLYLAVYGLDHPEQLLPALARLGERHLRYGVTPEQYTLVEEALTWMLEQGLEDEFTPEVRTAWKAAYRLLSEVMLQAAARLAD